jgi:hypothetical protein
MQKVLSKDLRGIGSGYSSSKTGLAYQNHICRVNGYNPESSYTYYPIIIIGAGESGIALGYKIKQRLGFDQFRIYDRQAGVGGTWWINRYPGVACDM